jgi:hypothetical protein
VLITAVLSVMQHLWLLMEIILIIQETWNGDYFNYPGDLEWFRIMAHMLVSKWGTLLLIINSYSYELSQLQKKIIPEIIPARSDKHV